VAAFTNSDVYEPQAGSSAAFAPGTEAWSASGQTTLDMHPRGSSHGQSQGAASCDPAMRARDGAPGPLRANLATPDRELLAAGVPTYHDNVDGAWRPPLATSPVHGARSSHASDPGSQHHRRGVRKRSLVGFVRAAGDGALVRAGAYRPTIAMCKREQSTHDCRRMHVSTCEEDCAQSGANAAGATFKRARCR
jgi:hypothetical protein